MLTSSHFLSEMTMTRWKTRAILDKNRTNAWLDKMIANNSVVSEWKENFTVSQPTSSRILFLPGDATNSLVTISSWMFPDLSPSVNSQESEYACSVNANESNYCNWSIRRYLRIRKNLLQCKPNLRQRVWGSYCKLHTEFFPPSKYNPSANHADHRSKGKNEDP